MKIYLVGGAVRDELLNLPVKERDWVVVGAQAEEMLALGFVPVGKFFPVFLHPQSKEEYALARLERKVAGGYHGFTFDTSPYVSLEEDLLRRDLTINAMAKTQMGEIIDPFGGQQDLQHKILRHVSPAFTEDPVRVLRIARFAARFASLGFKVASETIKLMREMVDQGELDFLVAERVWKEMLRALQEPTPVAFIQVLRECGALKIILPEIDRLYGEEEPRHVEMALHQATQISSDPAVRFAALLHDLGKTLDEKGETLVSKVCERLRVSKDFEELADLVAKWHDACHRILDNPQSERVLTLLEQCDAFRRPKRFMQFLAACEANFRAQPGYETVAYKQSNFLMRALEAAEKVDIPFIIKSKTAIHNFALGGEEIKKLIHAERLNAIEEILK